MAASSHQSTPVISVRLSNRHGIDGRSLRCELLEAWKMRFGPPLAGSENRHRFMGPLTGLGGDIFIIDDPQKPVDAQSDVQRNRLNHWVSNTLMSRLDSKETGIIIVVMQRVHLNDLSGYLWN